MDSLRAFTIVMEQVYRATTAEGLCDFSLMKMQKTFFLRIQRLGALG